MFSDPVVLLPPMLCTGSVWAGQVAALSGEAALMTAPLAGGERIEDIAQAILARAPERFALVGAGMGGAVALEIIRIAPARVSRIALISTTFQGETPEGASAREPLIVAARSGRFGDVIGAELNPAWLAPGPARLDVAAAVRAMALTLGAEAYVSQARALQRRPDHQRTLRTIAVPALVIGGEEDGKLPVKRHQFLSEFIPRARLEIVADAGHLPMMEQPDRVSEILRDWLGKPLVLR